MWREILPSSFLSPEFFAIFAISLVVLAAKIVFRYLSRVAVFVGEDAVAKKSAHFECLRTGLDLSFLGLVTLYAVCQLALSRGLRSPANEFLTMQFLFLVIQVILLGLTVFFMAIFHSPQKAFWKGILIPGLIGWFSLWVSASVFHHALSEGF